MNSIDPANRDDLQFTHGTIGLPDHVFLSPDNNKPHDGTLGKHIGGLDRSQRQLILRIFKKRLPGSIRKSLGPVFGSRKRTITDYYVNPTLRRFLYANDNIDKFT